MVSAAPAGMQMRDMYLAVTVSSSEMKPRVMSSAHGKHQRPSNFLFIRTVGAGAADYARKETKRKFGGEEEARRKMYRI